MNYVKHFLKGDWLRKAAACVADPAKMKWLVGRVRQCCGKDGLAKVRDHLSLLADMASDITGGRYNGYSKGNFLFAVAALIYVVSPLDLVPDFLIGLGLLDDVAIVGWAMSRLKDEVDKYQSFKSEQSALEPSSETAVSTRR